MKNKWLIIMMSIMSVGLGLIIMQGCENSKDTDLSGDLSNDYQSADRNPIDTDVSTSELQISPKSVKTIRVGEKFSFTVQGGQTPYAWSVADSSAGTVSVAENTHYGTYTVNAIAANEIIAQDNRGVRVSAQITTNSVVAPSPALL